MKKIISLIASVAMLATMVSSVFAADINNNAPVVENTVVEVSAEDYAAMMGASLDAGQKAYMITVNASGFDLQSLPGTGFGGTAKRTGVLLTTIDYRLNFEDESQLISAVAMDDGLAPAKPGAVLAAASFSTPPTMYPVIANTDTAGKAVAPNENVYINTFLIVTKGEAKANIAAEFIVCPYTNNVAGAQVVYRNDNDNISYTVNGEAATSITFGATEPDPEPPVPQDMTVTIGKEFELEAEGVQGYAWEVVIANYDSTKTLSAKFIDEATGLPRPGKPVTEITGLAAAETEGSIEFVALLKLSAPRSVSFDIVVE